MENNTDYVCEWCDTRATEFVGEHPEKCRVIYCDKHKTKTWHAPKKLIVGKGEVNDS